MIEPLFAPTAKSCGKLKTPPPTIVPTTNAINGKNPNFFSICTTPSVILGVMFVQLLKSPFSLIDASLIFFQENITYSKRK